MKRSLLGKETASYEQRCPGSRWLVDGSGWEGVYKTLTRNGYSVTVVQNPTMSLEDDVAYTKRALAAKDGPAILVGHSYGGAVITEAGTIRR